ncbi:macrophage mannose receptor 1 [Elysia marginata]|uniref:Macrophage mannose receptor 1 n=1 Tax=Elysia marginata TaxID=1093978 RepID=A0AAV4J092_9GAST|nr:macrophage mannose receptor 1 [Elysia marginata]
MWNGGNTNLKAGYSNTGSVSWGPSENCGIIKHRGGAKWSFKRCRDKKKYICEKRPIRLCPDGWTPSSHSKTCIRVFDEPQVWMDARKACQDRGGDLVITVNAQNNRFLKGNC